MRRSAGLISLRRCVVGGIFGLGPYSDLETLYRIWWARERYGPPFPAYVPSLLHTPPSAIAKRRRDSASRCARKGTRLYSHLHLHRLLSLSSFLVVRRCDPSVDYVFDGTSPPYAPSAQTNPLNLYATSKRDAELAVLGVEGARAAVLRVPVLCVFLFSASLRSIKI